MTIKNVDPISRIEGHLGVKLSVDGSNKVVEADVHGNLWRGFENFMLGRDVNDAITFTQRICGVCPIPHATASMFAVESVMGYNDNFVTFKDAGGKGVPEKALHIRNLVYSSEFIMSHITHFYHLAAPSYVMGPNMPPWTPYFHDDYYNGLLNAKGKGDAPDVDTAANVPLDDGGFAKDLWSAVIKQYVKALRIRRLTFEAGALFAGRMPMVSSFVMGGVTNTAAEDLTAKCDAFKSLISEAAVFIVREHLPLVLALGALYPNYDNLDNAQTANTALGLGLTLDGTNTAYGKGVGRFLAWGAFPKMDDTMTIKGGYYCAANSRGTGTASVRQYFLSGKTDVGTASTLLEASIRECIYHSRYDGSGNPVGEFDASGISYPGNVSVTVPKRDDEAKYSWLKAPRWLIDDELFSMEVGPFARMVVNEIYPIEGTLAQRALTNIPGYTTYVHPDGGGLDPRTVHHDLAVALLREGIATLDVVGVGTGLTYADVVAYLTAHPGVTIPDVYYSSGTKITGIIWAWISSLKGGLSTMDRLRGRAVEAFWLIQKMIGSVTKDAWSATSPLAIGTDGWIDTLATADARDTRTWVDHIDSGVDAVSGYGVSEAPRGALAHFITQIGGKIDKYQCVVPTTWNACPKDYRAGDLDTDGETYLGPADAKNRGPMEQAMIGIPYAPLTNSFPTATGGTGTAGGGVEALRIAQSFDPCIACAVH